MVGGPPDVTTDIAPAILWVTDPDGSCTYLSKQWYELTGQAPAEGLGFGWLDAVHSEDREVSSAELSRAHTLQIPFRLDYRLLGPDRTHRWVIAAGQPRFSPEGAFLGFVGSVLDITERKRDEESLRRSEEHFRALIEQSSDLICVLDADGTLRYVSPSQQRMLGYRLQELTGADTLQIIHRDDLPQALVALRRVLEAPDTAVAMELRVRRADGTWRRLQIAAFNRLDDPAVEGIVVNARDVTAQRTAEERLLRITATSPAVLYTLAPAGEDTRASWVSGNIEESFGYTVEQALSPGWWAENVHPADRSATFALMADLFRTGSLSHEYRFRHADGSYRWIRDALRVVQGPHGRPVEIVGSWMDATEFRELEKQFQQAQKMEAIGRLAGGIAHDFNNVLTAVTGFAQMMLEDLEEEHPLWGDAEEIVRAADRGASLVRQLMAFSRQQVIQPEVMSAAAVVSGMENMVRPMIGEDVVLVPDIDPEAGYVRADRGQVEQLVLNLVVNARDAMPDGGRLTISVQRVDLTVDAPTPAHADVPPGRWVVLSVVDTGSGMDEHTQAKMFEPFFTTKGVEKGTGLGLSIVYGIVRQGGGHIRVESAPGQGTGFHIYLPEVEPVVPTPSGPVEDVPRASSERVLLVEDQSSVRNLICRILERHGYTVLEAANAVEALRRFGDDGVHVDLLLTDVVMPGMSGRELAERLKTLRPDLPVLFMSGYAEDEIAHHGVLEAGTHFIGKPFTPDALARKAREVLASAPSR